uniref:NADH dehydrogenase subunit 4L n=1 Tax=Aplysia argus TaxID=2810296 RepID=UPI00202962C5|nr:NADH dehydrogenase subunit 4L [Aplysia argus]UPX89350.1 NADH dehydrogenase subunit 4L [Aplysia argus]
MLLFKVSLIGVFFASISFCSYQTHTLNLLISLEAVMLCLLLFSFSISTMFGMSSHLFLVLLTFAACEAALGLSLLVSMLRLRGNDLVTALSSLSFFAQNTTDKSCWEFIKSS